MTNWGQGGYVSPRVKDQIRRRDKTCRLQYPGICTGNIDEFDHTIGLAEQGVPRTSVLTAENIQGVCTPCHGEKTNEQRKAGITKAIAQRGSLSKRYRDQEQHPGEL